MENRRLTFSYFQQGMYYASTSKKLSAQNFLVLSYSLFEPPPDPSTCLVLEDAPNGIQAAFDAGMQSVMVPHKNISPQYCIKATQVINSLLDFHPEDFGLPPFKR